MTRSQTKKKGGRWYARETLDFSKAPQGGRPRHQTLGRCIQGMPLKALGLLDYLNSWPLEYVVTPKRIAHRFNLSVKTVRRLMEPLVKADLAEEGTAITASGSSIEGYVRRAQGQNGKAANGQNGKATSGQNGETPLKGKALSMDRPLTPSAFPSGNPSASLTKSSAGATFCENAEEKGALSLKTKPKPQGKKMARQREASITPCEPERREWVAVLDADGEDVIERLRRNDVNGFLHEKLFSRSQIAKLAAMLDDAEAHGAECYGAEFGQRARNAAVESIIGKLCGWNTCFEKNPGGIRSWDYFAGAIQAEVETAIEEMRYAA
jgi:hypothetical protein